MNFYNPFGFFTLLTIPAILVLYLLKQRHQDYNVSSLMLWNEVLKDIEANAPWQKLRKNILLFLQIAAMVLIALALSRPYLSGLAGKAENVVLILDTSMSMQASDIAPSRFEAAKKQSASYISNLKPGTTVTLISMGGSAIIEENLSKDKNSLLDSLKSIGVTNLPANTEDAIAQVHSIIRQQPSTEVVLFSDLQLKVPGIAVKHYDFSGTGGNYAVVLLSHSASKNGVTALSRIANFSSLDATIPVSLYSDGKVFDAKNIDIKAGETSDVYWTGIPASSKYIECRIDLKDVLDIDNTGWDALTPPATGKVLLASPQNLFIEKAISLMKDFELFKTNPDSTVDYKGYNLYIFDGFLPDKLPQDGNIMLLNPPPGKYFTVKKESKLPQVERSSHPLFNYINDYGFAIGKASIFNVPVWGEPVLESNDGTLIFEGLLENRKLLVFGFDIHNTDMALRPMFPILISNVLERLVPSTIKNVENITAGQSISFNLDPRAETVKVKNPSGKSTVLAPPFPARIFNDTGETGLYSLEQGFPEGSGHHYFAVNPPSGIESNLLQKTLDTVTEENAEDTDTVKQTRAGFNLQLVILWALLILLLIEWWVYSHGI